MSKEKSRKLDLTGRKRELLDALLKMEGVETREERIPRRNQAGPAPLSFAQQRLWFFDQFEPGSPAYNLMCTVRLSGLLDVDALKRGFDEIVRRHEVLRTNFDLKDGRPVQIVKAPGPVMVRLVNLANGTETDRRFRLEQFIKAEANEPFDLKHGPLLRVTLIRTAEREHMILVAMHHIVCDAWSITVLVRELSAMYPAFSKALPSPLPELPVQYADFAVWQRQWLQGDILERQLSYWKRQLAGDLPVIELQTDRPRPTLQTYGGASIDFPLSQELAASIRSLANDEGATSFMTLLAAYMTLLYRYTRQTDMVAGTTIANRNRAEIEPLIGFFTNTLVMRVAMSGGPSFKEVVHRVREVALGAYSHQDLPFEYLVEQLHPERDLSHSPLAQMMFVMQNTSGTEIRLPELTVQQLAGNVQTAKFDLTLYINDGDELEGAFEYNTDLFDRVTIGRMIGHFQTMLQQLTRHPSRSIDEVSILAKAEQHQLLVSWNETRVYCPAQCAHELFEAQAAKTPESIALVFEDRQLSYRELNLRANQLANYLRSLGAAPGGVVGACISRSAEMFVAVLGISKSGAACLPLDPSYPEERLAFIIEDAAASIVLSERGRLFASTSTAKIVDLADEWPSIAGQSEAAPETGASSENWAYLIYTSGSTGQPKGVAVPHRTLVNLAEWRRTSTDAGGRTLQFASLTFDVSFQEIFSTWHAGAALIGIAEALRADLSELGRYIERQQVSRFHLPVAVLHKLAAEFASQPEMLSGLRELMVGGEQLQITHESAGLFARLKDAVLYNHYGPSESHVVTSFRLPRNSREWPQLPPLGRPVSNTELYILDPRIAPVPIGVPGELLIGGYCLAHGYLGRTELTAEKFIPHPFSREPGARLYKTGDLARFRHDGNIEFLGRNDFQVKIRGFRVELGEIEVVLNQHPAVQQAVVVLNHDHRSLEKRLVAYLVNAPAASPSARELRDFLRLKLPDYMTPAVFVSIDSLPLTSSGKVDRLKLPAPDKRLTPDESYLHPETALEQALVAIWEDLLEIEGIGVNHNFFEIGGHSLLATQVATRLRETLGVDLALRKLFEFPTIKALANAITADETLRDKAQKAAVIMLRLRNLTDEDIEHELARMKQGESGT